jgi:phenylalanyl-tRNA synthetase alpha chain
MKEKLKMIQNTGLEEIKKADKEKEIERIRVDFLGKKGKLTLVLREMGKLPKEERL